MTMKIEEIKTVAVIGAGVMGSGIAQHLAQAGYEVRLHARHDETLAAARARVAKNQELMVETGLLTASAAAQAFSRIRTTTDLEEAARGVQFVNESAPEDLDLKGRIFAALDRSTPPEAILSTNTSGLSITAIAAATTRPERVVGLHWMNPPHLMPPVEVTRGTQTSSAVVDLTCDLARRIGRIPIRVERDVPGLLWNRLQFALVREAVHLVEEGVASPEGGGGGPGILYVSPRGPRGRHRRTRRETLCPPEAQGARMGLMSGALAPRRCLLRGPGDCDAYRLLKLIIDVNIKGIDPEIRKRESPHPQV